MATTVDRTEDDMEMNSMIASVEPTPEDMIPTETMEMIMRESRTFSEEENSEKWIEEAMQELKKPDQLSEVIRHLGEDHATESPEDDTLESSEYDMIESPQPSMEPIRINRVQATIASRQVIISSGPKLPIFDSVGPSSEPGELLEDDAMLSDEPDITPMASSDM